MTDAIFMAEDATAMWLWNAESNSESIPAATALPFVLAPHFANCRVRSIRNYIDALINKR